MWWQGQRIPTNIEEVRRRIRSACERAGRSTEGVTIVAISKGFPPQAVEEAFSCGLRHFGENRVQEAESKVHALAHLGATWHMVGHLQTNKVKSALSLFSMIHSVDSLRLGEGLQQRAWDTIPVLLQVNVAREETKFGFSPEEVFPAFKELTGLSHLDIRGLMTVAPVAADPEEVRPVFRRLRQLNEALGLKELSMGMSDDFEVAVEEGATLLRLGRCIFGEREQRG